MGAPKSAPALAFASLAERIGVPANNPQIEKDTGVIPGASPATPATAAGAPAVVNVPGTVLTRPLGAAGANTGGSYPGKTLTGN